MCLTFQQSVHLFRELIAICLAHPSYSFQQWNGFVHQPIDGSTLDSQLTVCEFIAHCQAVYPWKSFSWWSPLRFVHCYPTATARFDRPQMVEASFEHSLDKPWSKGELELICILQTRQTIMRNVRPFSCLFIPQNNGRPFGLDFRHTRNLMTSISEFWGALKNWISG